MYLRFFRRVRLAPNLWLNLSRSGVSWSVGLRGLRATVGKTGARLTVGLPGTGLSVTQHIQKRSRKAQPALDEAGSRLLEKVLRGE
jgi:hypothetical protein